MKSRFWASVIAIILVVLTVVLIWFLNGKPIAFSDEELMILDIATVALCFSIRNDLLRDE